MLGGLYQQEKSGYCRFESTAVYYTRMDVFWDVADDGNLSGFCVLGRDYFLGEAEVGQR